MHVPDDLRYTKDHEWVRVEGDLARVGITDYAQDALGDVVFVQVPETGAEVAMGDMVSEVESSWSWIVGRSWSSLSIGAPHDEQKFASSALRCPHRWHSTSGTATPRSGPGTRRHRAAGRPARGRTA